MLSDFDWLRRTRTGVELLATLKYLTYRGESSHDGEENIGPPPTALSVPCLRCWIYRRDEEDENYCEVCKNILIESKGLGSFIRQFIVLWGYLNEIPYSLQEERWKVKHNIHGPFFHGKNRFLIMLKKKDIKPLLQDLVIRHGPEMKGLIQTFPTIGMGSEIGMGDILCRAIHHESNRFAEQLWIRFYSSPVQLTNPGLREDKGMLTFEVSEFVALLETAEVFRSLLKPEEQENLYEILLKDKFREHTFYWGRFLGQLNKEARDMITGWGIRQWPRNRLELLYELTDYVAFS
ncbi:MAG TPA: hypothetical protein VJ024_00280 [Thermodesulfovibrionales bacterium]|nr:hypothetical protein [Thermodesulfovibrionales bacterium]